MIDRKAEQPKLLVVEDDDDIRNLLASLFGGEGYRVVAASNGKTGLQLLDQEPDVRGIVADLGMPEIGGDRFVRAVRAEGHPYRSARILLISGRPAETVFTNDPELRPLVDDFLPKPFDLDEIMNKVNRLVPTGEGPV